MIPSLALVLIFISYTDLPYRSPCQPYASWATLFFVILVVFFSGFDVFVDGRFTATGFLTCYLNIFIFAGQYTITPIRLDVQLPLTFGF